MALLLHSDSDIESIISSIVIVDLATLTHVLQRIPSWTRLTASLTFLRNSGLWIFPSSKSNLAKFNKAEKYMEINIYLVWNDFFNCHVTIYFTCRIWSLILGLEVHGRSQLVNFQIVHKVECLDGKKLEKMSTWKKILTHKIIMIIKLKITLKL